MLGAPLGCRASTDSPGHGGWSLAHAAQTQPCGSARARARRTRGRACLRPWGAPLEVRGSKGRDRETNRNTLRDYSRAGVAPLRSNPGTCSLHCCPLLVEKSLTGTMCIQPVCPPARHVLGIFCLKSSRAMQQGSAYLLRCWAHGAQGVEGSMLWTRPKGGESYVACTEPSAAYKSTTMRASQAALNPCEVQSTRIAV